MQTMRFKNLDFEVKGTLSSREQARCLHVSDSVGEEWILKVVDVGRLPEDEAHRLVEHFRKVVQIVPSLKNYRIDLDLQGQVVSFLKHYTPGVSLDRAPKNLTHLQIVRLGKQVLEQLIDLHDYGLIHGDLKPSNMIVSGDRPEVHLIDHAFLDPKLHLSGLAKTKLIGTVAYSAPEQSGLIPRVIDHRADLYSLGIVLLELLCRERAFPGPTMGDVFKQQLLHQPRLKLFGSSIPPSLSECVLRMCRLDPGDRYQSTRAALHDFERIEEILEAGQPQRMILIGKTDQRRVITDPPFVGRQEHIDRVVAHLERIPQKAALVKVAGNSGVGKSSLLARIQSEAIQKEFTVIRGQGIDEGARTPLGILLPLFQYISSTLKDDRLLKDRLVAHMGMQLESLCLVLPFFAETLGFARPAVVKKEEFGEIRTVQALHQLLLFLDQLSSPLLVILDDCQWADDLSIKVIRSWSHEKDGCRRMLMLVSYRSEEISSQSLLSSVESTEDIEILPFALEDVKKIVLAMAGKVPDRVIDDVYLISNGNPFMIGSLLRGLVESQAIVFEDDSWQINYESDGDIKASTKAASSLIQRLELLEEAELSLLTKGAVLGKEFSILDVASIAGLDPSEALKMMRNAGERQLIWFNIEKQKVIFLHDKIREALLGRLPADVRRELHRSCAVFYEKNDPRNCFQLSYHYNQADDMRSALPHAIQAARRAREQFSIPIALAQYAIAEKGLRDAADPALENKVVLEHAELLMLHGHYALSKVRFQGILGRVRDPLQLAGIYAKIGDIEFKSGGLKAASENIEKGLALLGVTVPRTRTRLMLSLFGHLARQAVHTITYSFTVARRKKPIPRDVDLRCQLLSRMAYICWFYKGLVDCAWAHLKEMNDAEGYAPSESLAQAYSEHSPVATMVPWYSRGLSYAGIALKIRQDLHNDWGAGQSYHFLGAGFYAASRFDECIEHCRKAVNLMKKVGDQWEINTANWHISYAYFRKGDHRKAMELAEKTFAAAAEIGDIQASGIALAIQTKATQGATDTERVKRAYAHSGPDYHLKIELLTGLALCHLHREEWDDALAAVLEGGKILKEKNLRSEYVAPLRAYTATVFRARLLSRPPSDLSRFRQDLKTALKAASSAVRLSRSYRNNLPHALRELAILQTVTSKRRKARRLFTKAAAIAKEQGALFEYHETLRWMEELGFGDFPESQSWIMTLKNQMGLREGTKTQQELSTLDRYSNIIRMGEKLFRVEDESSVFGLARETIASLFRVRDFHLFRAAVDGESGALQGLSRALWKRAVQEESAVLHIGGPNDLSESIILSESNSKLYAPIKVNNRLYAGFGLESELHSLYTEEDLQLANFVAALVGASLQNVLLLVDQKALNRDLTRTVGELENHRLKLEIAKREAEAGNVAKSQFLAAISHDLRTPLTAIRGFADLLVEEGSSDLEFLRDKIVTNSDRLLSLINELLDFSRAESGTLDINLHKFNLYDLVSDLAALMEPLCAQKGNRFFRDIHPDVPRFFVGDGKRIEQILTNLVGNSVKFCSNGKIFLKVRWESVIRGKGLLSFQVRDEGIGIAPEFHAKIFESFFQVDQSNIKQAGTGLGLSLAKKLARSMGGDLFLDESSPGEGSQFTFQVPATVTAPELFPAPKKEAQIHQVMPLKILVVEDVADNRQLIGIYLKRLNGEITFAENGQEALAAVKGKTFDVVLMDIQMPVMDGWETIDALRESGHLSPILVVSANAAHSDRIRGLRKGCHGYLTKPIDFAQMVEHLKTIDSYLVHNESKASGKEAEGAKRYLLDSGILSELARFIELGDIEGLRLAARQAKEDLKNAGLPETALLMKKIEDLAKDDNSQICLINVFLDSLRLFT